MGQLFSNRTTRQKQLDADQESTYRKLHKQTGVPVSDLREWHFVFRRIYPRGITCGVFVRECLEAHGGDEGLWEAAYRVADTTGDGSLTFVQYITQLHKKRTLPMERRIKETFKFFDADGDGVVSEEELAEGLAQLYALPEVERLLQSAVEMDNISELEAEDPVFRAKALIAKFDFDGDLALSETEFVECCRSDQGVTEALGLVIGRQLV